MLAECNPSFCPRQRNHETQVSNSYPRSSTLNTEAHTHTHTHTRTTAASCQAVRLQSLQPGSLKVGR